MWLPLVLRPGVFWEASRATGWLTVLGRLRAGVSAATAEAELTVLAKQLEQAHARSNAGKSAGRVTPLADEIAGPVAPVIALLAAAVSAVLVIACGNITSLLLAARAGRRREFAVRAAIGAARSRVVRQVFAENLILCLLGGAWALAVAPWMANAFVSLYPAALPGASQFGVTAPMIAAGAVAALLAALVLTVPQLISQEHGLRVDTSFRGTPSRADRVLRRGLVVLQIALSFVLLAAGAGLARTVHRLTALDPGFRPAGVLTFTLSPSRQKYPSATETLDFHQAAVDAIRSTPGVRVAAAALAVPLTSSAHRFGLQPPGQPVATLVSVNHAMPGYFEALGIPLLAGRLLTAEEHRGGRVAVVNRTLADALRGVGPVPGVRIPYAGESWQVVGVVEGSRQRELREPPAPEIFLPWRMAGARPQTIVVRADGNPLAVLPAIAARIHDLDPTMPLAKIATLASRVADARQTDVFRAALVLALAAIASALAALGAYSVTAFAVTARAREFGVRLALGERPRSIAGRAIWTAAGPSLWGIALGAVVTVPAGRWLDAFLYNVKAHDPATLSAVAALLTLLSLAAAARSAIVAARADPVNTLRADS